MVHGDYVNLVRTASNKLTSNMVKMANEVHISSQIMSPASLNCREIRKRTVGGVVVHCLLLTGPLQFTPHGSRSKAKCST